MFRFRHRTTGLRRSHAPCLGRCPLPSAQLALLRWPRPRGRVRLGHPIALAVLAAACAWQQSTRASGSGRASRFRLLRSSASLPRSSSVRWPRVIVGAAGLLADLPRRDVEQPILRWINWTSVRVFAAARAGASGIGGNAVSQSAVSGRSSALSPSPSSSRPLWMSPCLRLRRQSGAAVPWRSTVRLSGPSAHRERSAPGADGRRTCVRVHNDLALERRALRASCHRRSATAPALPAAARDRSRLSARPMRDWQRRTCRSQQLSSRRSTRETGTRQATRLQWRFTRATSRNVWGSRRENGSLLISVASCTTSGRSDWPRDSWRSRAR